MIVFENGIIGYLKEIKSEFKKREIKIKVDNNPYEPFNIKDKIDFA